MTQMGVATSFIVRSAGKLDAEGIAKVHVACWNETYTGLLPESLIGEVSYDRRLAWRRAALMARYPQTFVAVEHGVIVGFLDCGSARDPGMKMDGEIFAIYLLKAYQKRGIGLALLKKGTESLLADGHLSAYAWVLNENTKAIGFYTRVGARLLGQRSQPRGHHHINESAYGWTDVTAIA